MELEVLLEIGSSRKRLSFSRESILSAVETELKLMGDVALLPLGKAPSDFPAGKELYILQRWSEKWGSFVDVKEVDEIISGDRLTVVPVPKTAGGSNVSLTNVAYTGY